MSTTEDTTNQPTPKESAVPDTSPSVVVNPPIQSIPTSQNSQNSQSNKANPNLVMALVICFMLIIGLAAAFYFKLNEASGGMDKATELNEKEELQRLIQAERGGASLDGRASAALIEGKFSSILNDVSAAQSEFEVLKASYRDAQEKLTQAGNELQGNMSTISRLGSENIALRSQIAQLQDLARNAQAYQNQVQQLANTIAEKDAQIAAMQGRPSNEKMEQLQKMLSDEQDTKLTLLKEIQEFEQKMRTMTAPENAANVEELQGQNEDLRIKLQALQTSIDFGKLFVQSHKDLPAKAQALYTELSGLKVTGEEDLRDAYTKIAAELKAETLQHIKFEEGSSILNFTDQTTIKAKLDQTDDDDYFLVVGYASLPGDAAFNEKLSANRATAVASIVNQLKREGQDVRAVYLGQTDRFSKEEHASNQLCEIWRIKK